MRSTSRTALCTLTAALLLTGVASVEGASRLEGYTAKAAKGKKIQPLVATYLGGKSTDEFVAVGVQPDGTVVAMGNAWGPELPPELKPTVLGEGEWYDVNEFAEGEATTLADNDAPVAAKLDVRYPNKAGLIVRLSPDLQKVTGASRFDWGVAGITSGLVMPDGGIIIHGAATAHFEALAKQTPSFQTVPKPQDPRTGRFSYQTMFLPGDVYVARLSPDATKLEWAWLLKGHRETSRLRRGPEGSVVFQTFGGLKRISSDGKTISDLSPKGGGGQRGRFLAVSPKDGTILRGGDTNSGTGREPWRKPLFYGYDAEGQWRWSIYDWAPGLVGHDDFRLVSDSSVRVATFDADNNMLVYGWSDGGNTVFLQNPVDLEKGVDKHGFGMSLWGAGVGSFCHLMKIRMSDFEVLAATEWAAYLMPDDKTGKDQPNSVTVHAIWPLADGSIAVAGGAAAWLVQTPDPWFKHPKFDNLKMASGGTGPYITVFSPDFSQVYFSRIVPGCEIQDMCETPKGLVFAGRSTGEMKGERNHPSPVLNAMQGQFGGGRFDAYLLMLEKPPGGPHE